MTSRTLLLASIVALGTACSDDAPPDGPNPAKLWLALDGSEVQVKLSPIEPGTY